MSPPPPHFYNKHIFTINTIFIYSKTMKIHKNSYFGKMMLLFVSNEPSFQKIQELQILNNIFFSSYSITMSNYWKSHILLLKKTVRG